MGHSALQFLSILRLPRWLNGKESSRNAGDTDPWVGKIPWRGKWQSTPVFLPGKSHGQWNLAVYSLWGRQRVVHNLSDYLKDKIYQIRPLWAITLHRQGKSRIPRQKTRLRKTSLCGRAFSVKEMLLR